MKNDKLYTLVEQYVRSKLLKEDLAHAHSWDDLETTDPSRKWFVSGGDESSSKVNTNSLPSRKELQTKGMTPSPNIPMDQEPFSSQNSSGNPSIPSPTKKTPVFKPFKPVSAYQNMLKNLGYGSGVVSGKFDPQTKQAIKKFQSEHGLPVSGRPDKRTWLAMVDREMSFQDTAQAANQKGLDRINATKNTAHTGPERIDAVSQAKNVRLNENSLVEDYKLLLKEELKRAKK